MGLNGLFDIARSALTTTQQALTVTGHNVANVNTPGYSRQEAILTERAPLNGRPGMVGTGVQATHIRRVVDQFVERELTGVRQTLGKVTASREELFRLQGLLGDTNNQGIGARLNEFFMGLQDVASNPADVTPRSVLLAKASLLTTGLNQVATDLSTSRLTLNSQIKQTVTEINSLTKQIAELNDKIVSAEVSGQNANDLRDQRGVAVNELAERIDIATIESGNGAVSVFAARGQVIVEGGITRRLATVESLDNDGLLDIGYDTGGTKALSISSLITSGRLKGLLDVRDATIPDLQRSFDRLAATLVNEVNQIHRQGYGLDGSTGLDFFAPLAVTTHANTTNQGSAAIASGPITANSLLTFHDYEIRFTSATAYSIVDATTGSTIKGNYTGTAVTAPTVDVPVSIVTGSNDTLTVTVDGTTSGTITLAGAASPGQAYTSGASLAVELQNKINADATLQAAGRTVAVTYDTTTSRFVITSNSTSATSAVTVTGGTARTTLGLASGTSTPASGTYSGPQTLAFDGLSVTLSGTPAANDVFAVNSYDDAAKNLGVALTNGSKIAASSILTGIPGNNDNALALVVLQNRKFAGLGTATFSDAYRNAAASLGIAAQTADRELQAQEILKEQIDTFRAQTSGVSIDEELVNLIKYQRGFEAASRLIVVADEMFQTLLAIKR